MIPFKVVLRDNVPFAVVLPGGEAASLARAFRDAASDFADDAADSAAAAQLAESGAVAANGTLYPDIATGLAATAANGYFTVVGDGTNTYAILYRKVSGAEVEQAQYASKAAFEGPAGFTLIRYKRPESGTFARTAAQRVLAGIGDDGLYVNEWIDPALDEQIAHNNQSVDVDLSPAFNAAITASALSAARGVRSEVKIAPGRYTIAQPIQLSHTQIKLVGCGRVVLQQMDDFVDAQFEAGTDLEILRPRLLICDALAAPTPTFIRNHRIENIIARGNGSDTDMIWDRGVANSWRTNLAARNIGGAMTTALACVDTAYMGIQVLYGAEGSPTEQQPDYGLVVGRALLPSSTGGSAYNSTTQCKFDVRFEEATIAAVFAEYADTCFFTGIAEALAGGGVLVGSGSSDNEFYQFYQEANGGLDWDIYGARTLIHNKSTSYNNRDATSIRVRDGAFLTTIENMGNIKTIIEIDDGALHTNLRNVVAKDIIDNSPTTHQSGYIYNLTQSADPQYPGGA